MTDQHPITPHPDLVQQWRYAASNVPASLATDPGGRRDYIDYIATQAARWGSDQELEACCEWITERRLWEWASHDLRAARRPKPPSLARQALAVIENSEICDHLSPEHAAILRRALEQLDD